MGTITVNIDNNIENEFRTYLSDKGEILKGALGKAITEAIAKWLKEKKQEEIAIKAIERMKEGFSSGGFKIKSRSELHERRTLSGR
ncbi:hypothetical protein J4216_04765 [Candidatus Woesearchaeota archaeon]|nr:hypothetical protein [Candidatus Woesearchaeota archaeon]